jgi:hypothetical protein
MNEESSIKPTAAQDPSDTDVLSLLKKMQQQLLFLEKKIDLLVSQSQEKPSGERAFPERSFRKRSFSKPFRSYDQPSRHGKGEPGHSPRERNSAPGHFYERRPHQKSAGPSPRKKPFSFHRKDRD